MTPLELENALQKHGYRRFAYTDHRILHRHDELADEKFFADRGL
jgi:hypothetical protein